MIFYIWRATLSNSQTPTEGRIGSKAYFLPIFLPNILNQERLSVLQRYIFESSHVDILNQHDQLDRTRYV
jgi:hypothetical protein